MLNRSSTGLSRFTIRHAYTACNSSATTCTICCERIVASHKIQEQVICKRSAVTRALHALDLARTSNSALISALVIQHGEMSNALGPYLFSKHTTERCGDIDVAGDSNHPLTTSDQSPLYSGLLKQPQLIYSSCPACLEQFRGVLVDTK